MRASSAARRRQILRRRLTLLAGVVAVAIAAAFALGSGDDGAGDAPRERRASKPLVRTGPPIPSPLTRERCFGAASRDPRRPCVNSALAKAVHPSPATVRQEPNATCVPVGQTDILLPCEFGVPEDDAKDTFALIGDSHASHWRATLEGLAQKKRWRGVTLARSGCPFSMATAALPGAAALQCVRWNRAVLQWLEDHPQVHYLFVSNHRGGEVLHPPGVGTVETQVAGYRQVWDAVPDSVSRIFIIRDTPREPQRSAKCLAEVVRRLQLPATGCGVPRRVALKPDAGVTAARRAASPRIRLIDLSRYMCDARECLPVVGGALVHRDSSHITQTFAATLAPYLQRRVETVLAGPPPAP